MGLVKNWKTSIAIDKLYSAYMHEGTISRAEAQAKIVDLGKYVSPNWRPHVVTDILKLNLAAIGKEKLPTDQAAEATVSAAHELDFQTMRLNRCVLAPYIEGRNAAYFTPETNHFFQSLFHKAANGEAFENSQVIVSGKLGPQPDSIAVAFKNVAGPLVLAEGKALPAPKMFLYLDQVYPDKDPSRRPYLMFVADVMSRQP
jgi:hypothetical protein